MPFKIVRNDITKMNTDAIVNTANEAPVVGPGCDFAVYQAAGRDRLLAFRKEKIGPVPEGEVFVTPGFDLPAKYIIHAVSPLYVDGGQQEEEKLRSCYRRSLAMARGMGLASIAFPLISTGSFGYPKEEGMRIAVDEIHAFLLTHDMMVYLVVFDEKAARMGASLYPDLEAYIDRNYVEAKQAEEYYDHSGSSRRQGWLREERIEEMLSPEESVPMDMPAPSAHMDKGSFSDFRKTADIERENIQYREDSVSETEDILYAEAADEDAAIEEMERHLAERLKHRSDTFPEYLFYLIGEKGMKNAEVYKRAIVDKKVFSKIKSNPDYHPQKLTALCLCIGAKLNLDESRDLLARAGYALSPCDKTDIIFSYFIENGIYDMIELDIQLEEHGLPCIIS